MDAEGRMLLRLVIGRCADLAPLVREGDCKSIAVIVNGWMPANLQLAPADIYEALKGSPDFGGPKMNSEILRARIDAIPCLYSARINGDVQCILNELNRDRNEPPATIEDVRAAMALRAVPKPTRVARGAAAMTGKARLS